MVHWQEVIMGKAQNKHFFRHSCCTKYFPTRMSFSAQGMNSGGVEMLNCSNVEMFKCSKVQIFKCSNVQMLSFSNVQTFKCSNVELFKCSNVQMFKCWTGQQICWLVKVLNTDLTAARAVFSITEWDETFLLKGFSFHHHFCSQTLFMMQKISEPGERHDPWVNREPSSEKYVARTDSRQAKGMRGGWGWLYRMTFSKA